MSWTKSRPLAHMTLPRAKIAPHAGSRPKLVKVAIAAFALLVSPTFAAAQLSVAVHYQASDVAAKACAEEIENNKSVASSLEPAITFDHEFSGWSMAGRLHIGLSSNPDGAIGIIRAPFAIQNVQHFSTFLKSDLYRELRERDRDRWTAVAYGGSYQLFSRARAFTEPAHFYSQYIGGANYAALYTRFKSKLSPGWIAGSTLGGEVIRGDVGRMEGGDIHIDAIEAPVIDAFENGLGKAARFVNQTFSSVKPVFFQIKGRYRWQQGVQGVWMPWNANEDIKRTLTKWVETAAAACSARNFDIEQKTLQRLKDAGLQVVPVNRAALAKAGWAYGLTSVTRDWTISELDRLVRLAEGNVSMPSTMVGSLTAKERAAVAEIEKRIADSRKQ